MDVICACARFGKANILDARTNSSVISRTLAVQVSYKLILGANQDPFYFSQGAEGKTCKLRGRHLDYVVIKMAAWYRQEFHD